MPKYLARVELHENKVYDKLHDAMEKIYFKRISEKGNLLPEGTYLRNREQDKLGMVKIALVEAVNSVDPDNSIVVVGYSQAEEHNLKARPPR